MDYEIVIGLEVHCQLQTASKLFCGCENSFTHEANTHICPVCLGLPGSLPVLNRTAFEYALRAALALNCSIPELTKFDRKHYYYPDLPKNYQISQYDMPMSNDGFLDVTTEAGLRRIGVTRVHIEEDAGKLVHQSGYSGVDLNRTGTPLIEIVSEPDIRTPGEARSYLELLKLILLYLEVSDCNMEEGSLRCDANISIREKGAAELGVKNEIKNMNSFRGVESALQMVADDLLEKIKSGTEIQQVTWGYSVERNRIFQMRVKEDANDYRYFPDPDLPPVRVSREWVSSVRDGLPELPQAKQNRFEEQFSLSPYDASVLTQDMALAAYFEAVASTSGANKESANWVTNDVARELNERKVTIDDFALSAGKLAELIKLVSDKVINMPTAKKIFLRIADGAEGTPKEIVERDGLGQVSDTGPITEALEEVIQAHPDQVATLEGGKHSAAMWFVGQVMQKLKGKAAPDVVVAAIAERFGIDPSLLQKKKKKK